MICYKKFRFLSLFFMAFLFFSCATFSIQYDGIEPDYINDRKHVKQINENSAVNVLSIDGGGVRGIIPARVLEQLESKTRRPINELFDLIVGTSTGAILSLGLSTPNGNKTIRTSHEMANIYKDLAKDIFPSYVFGTYYGGLWLPSNLWWGSEYSAKPLETKLNEVLRNAELKSLVVPTVITSVDARDNTLKLFRSHRAAWKPAENFFVKDVARATSAAPTYFPIKKVTSVDGTSTVNMPLVDGGMAANNPSLIALSEAYNLFGHERKINLISLGTGSKINFNNEPKEVSYIKRGSPTIDMLFDAQSDSVDKVLVSLQESRRIEYYRVQVPLEENHLKLDCANNVIPLYEISNKYVNGDNKTKIDNISITLNNTLAARIN